MIYPEPLARIEADGTIRYYHKDALGSVIALTTENGQLATVYSYDPFGNVTVSGMASDNPFQYTGRENDNTGLYYYRARYYSPELQRFISEDPILRPISSQCVDIGSSSNRLIWLVPSMIKEPQNLYPYVYVGNNPVNFTDPSGLSRQCEVCEKWRGRAYWGFNFMCRCCFICIPKEGVIFGSFRDGICVWGTVGNSRGYVGRHDVCNCDDPDGNPVEIPFDYPIKEIF